MAAFKSKVQDTPQSRFYEAWLLLSNTYGNIVWRWWMDHELMICSKMNATSSLDYPLAKAEVAFSSKSLSRLTAVCKFL